MGKALYRKHRPKKLSEIIGQEHITSTLESALKQGTISHAYLLTGPRGVGKTSIARILAYEVNGLPYDEEGIHMDIIEIDAASNRRIDEIRELKERVNIAPTSAKYKVYIIDEVHMLTKEAFNALLKTLEEPPEHVIFILATTEAHKVPDTIISRTQRFSLKPIDQSKVAEHLQMIAKAEDITIDEHALELIAAHGDGSFRDSISLLDQVRHVSSAITLRDVQRAVGQAPDELIQDLLQGVANHDIQALSISLSALRDHGVQAPQTAQQVSKMLRHTITLQQSTLSVAQSLELLGELLQVPASHNPDIALELSLYGSTLNGNAFSPPQIKQKQSPVSEVEKPKAVEKNEPKIVQPEQKAKPAKQTIDNLNAESWQKVLSVIRTKHNTLYGITRMGVPEFEPGKLKLVFAFGFHQKLLNDPKNKQLLQDIIADVTIEHVTIECVLDKNSNTTEPTPRPANEKESSLNLENISNIFGGAEIVK